MCDLEYWDTFYKSHPNHDISCSSFCNFIINHFNTISGIHSVLDAGCGNGRDSYELAKKYSVTGVDNCGVIPVNVSNAIFDICDFTSCNKSEYDLIYSRFTLHSITDEKQNDFLESIPTGCYVAIEARSIKGIADNCIFGKDHYRNYINFESFSLLLNTKGFDILYRAEGNHMAPYKEEDPICVRFICRKL